jgi:hypothetical protein
VGSEVKSVAKCQGGAQVQQTPLLPRRGGGRQGGSASVFLLQERGVCVHTHCRKGSIRDLSQPAACQHRLIHPSGHGRRPLRKAFAWLMVAKCQGGAQVQQTPLLPRRGGCVHTHCRKGSIRDLSQPAACQHRLIHPSGHPSTLSLLLCC